MTTNNHLSMQVGERLKALRKKAGLTQQELAARVAEHGGTMHQTTIMRTEKGTRNVTLNEYVLLTAALNVPPRTLQDEIVALRRANDDLAGELGRAEDAFVDLIAERDSLEAHLGWHHPGGVCLDVDVTGDALLDPRRDDTGRPPG